MASRCALQAWGRDSGTAVHTLNPRGTVATVALGGRGLGGCPSDKSLVHSCSATEKKRKKRKSFRACSCDLSPHLDLHDFGGGLDLGWKCLVRVPGLSWDWAGNFRGEAGCPPPLAWLGLGCHYWPLPSVGWWLGTAAGPRVVVIGYLLHIVTTLGPMPSGGCCVPRLCVLVVCAHAL